MKIPTINTSELIARAGKTGDALFRKELKFCMLLMDVQLHINDHFMVFCPSEKRFSFDHDYGVVVRVADKSCWDSGDGSGYVSFVLWRLDSEKDPDNINAEHNHIVTVTYIHHPQGTERWILTGNGRDNANLNLDSHEEFSRIWDSAKEFVRIILEIMEAPVSE